MSNPCIKCGKERIDGKSWKGKTGISIVTYTRTICPDSKCQEVVDAEIASRKNKAASLIKAKADAKIAREKLLTV